MKQGIHSIPAEAYHRDPCETPSLSASVAHVLITQSPAHARMQHPRLFAGYQPEQDSRFDLGTAAHAMLLERDESRLVIVEANDWRTNAAKQVRDDARAAGKLPILSKHSGPLREMVRVAREAVEQSELAGIFSDGAAEQTVIWEDDGVLCRARPDFLTPDIVLDYKTTDSAAPEAFIRKIAPMGYDLQAEFYMRGIAAVDAERKAFVFLVQEIEPPFACSLVALANSFREIAAAKVEKALALWRTCMAKNYWPAYPLAIHYAEPPAWAINEFIAEQGDWK